PPDVEVKMGVQAPVAKGKLVHKPTDDFRKDRALQLAVGIIDGVITVYVHPTWVACAQGDAIVMHGVTVYDRDLRVARLDAFVLKYPKTVDAFADAEKPVVDDDFVKPPRQANQPIGVVIEV